MTTPLDLDVLLACAERAARAAGRHAVDNAHRRDEIAERFPHDVKLKLDGECQRRAEEAIHRQFPGHPILGEEGISAASGEGYVWIVDPIDGTVNFMHGLPLWCSSVAVRCGRDVLAGAVYVPMLEECYTATRVGPALCNGKPIAPSRTPALEESLVLTGLSKHVSTNVYSRHVLEAIAVRVQKTRILGAAAVDICSVAAGRADGYFETGIYLWDIAAAGLIAERAGARAEVVEELGDYRYRFLVTNGLIHESLKSVVLEALR